MKCEVILKFSKSLMEQGVKGLKRVINYDVSRKVIKIHLIITIMCLKDEWKC